MTPAGWIIMFLSVGSMTVLFVWCIYRVLTSAPPERLHGIEDIDLPDVKDD